MSDTPEIKLNEFGDLSRRQRRELEARGIDPDTAVIEYLNTQSIPIQRPAEPAVTPVTPAADPPAASPTPPPVSPPAALPSVTFDSVAEVPVVPLDSPTTTAEIFPASMSSREIRHVLDRSEPKNSFDNLLAEPVVDAPANPIPPVIPVPTPTVELPTAADDELVDTLDQADDARDFDVDDVAGPTTIAEATAAAALEEAIAAHQAARADNGIEPDVPLPDLSDFEDFSGPATGSIPTISNALILPTLPEDTGTVIPVVATGELIVTEQLTLPSSIAQVGADFGTLDTSELDIIVDEEQITPSQDLAPVRAVSAISGYNSNNAVVTVPKRMNDRLPLVLSITAGALAVAVVAMFVTGYILGIL